MFFKAFIHAEIIPPKKVILFDENNSRHLLEGEVYVLLTPYLSAGSYSTDHILNHLEEKISAAEIYYALLRLKEMGFIEEISSKLPKSIQSFCNLLDVSCDLAEKKLQNTSISIQTFGNIKVDLLKPALLNLSLNLNEQGKDLIIAVTDNYRDSILKEQFLKAKIPFLLIKPTRSEVWIGPLFIPEKGPCFNCLLEALKNNSFEELFIENETKRVTPLTISSDTFSTMSALAYNLAAHEIFKYVVRGSNDDLESKILSYHFMSPTINSHQVLKKKHCLNCGTSFLTDPKPIILNSQKKRFTEDGGHRIHSPEQTFKNYEHLISPITGVIEYIIPTQKDEFMHTYQAGHGMQGTHLQESAFINFPRGKSGGKGKSAAQGKTSCLCEALERYSGIFQGNEPKKRASYLSIKNDAIHPYSLLLFSEKQYKIRNEWNKKGSSFHFIPCPYQESDEIDWTPVWSISKNRFKYIPSAMCYFAYPFSNKEKIFCRGDSNGGAAGNTKEEAILQGFFELVERDSIAIWWYSRIQRQEVDLTSFPDSHIERLISAYQSKNRKIWVIDITMDLNIPTFAAISCNTENDGEILFGFGCHFDPSIALLRALTEMNQPLLFIKARGNLKLISSKEEAIFNWLENETLQSHPYLIPTGPKKKLLDYYRFDTNDIKEDILICNKIVESKGLEMFVLDQTRPDIGLPVVKVFVPGLRHFWNRFAPGRLYDVPFELGLVKKKLKEEELNPIPFFL